MRLSGPLALEDEFNQVVELTVTAKVGDKELHCRQVVLAGVYADTVARKAIEEALRQSLMMEILKHWKPVIKVRR